MKTWLDQGGNATMERKSTNHDNPFTLLHESVERDELNLAKLFIDAGSNINAKNE